MLPACRHRRSVTAHCLCCVMCVRPAGCALTPCLRVTDGCVLTMGSAMRPVTPLPLLPFVRATGRPEPEWSAWPGSQQRCAVAAAGGSVFCKWLACTRFLLHSLQGRLSTHEGTHAPFIGPKTSPPASRSAHPSSTLLLLQIRQRDHYEHAQAIRCA